MARVDQLSHRLDFATITSVLIGCLFPLALGAAFGGDPPWPEEPGYAAAFLNAPITFACMGNPPRSRTALKAKLTVAFSLCAASLLIYLVLLGLFVHHEPTTGNQVVAGFVCTEEAKLLVQTGQLQGACPFLPGSALENAAYKPEVVWTSLSIRIVEVSLGIAWIAFFVVVTYACAISFSYATKKEARAKS